MTANYHGHTVEVINTTGAWTLVRFANGAERDVLTAQLTERTS